MPHQTPEPWDDHAADADPSDGLAVDFSFQPFENVSDPLTAAAHMFFRDLPLIAAITVIVFGPVELAKNYWLTTSGLSFESAEAFFLDMLVSCVGGPIVAAAVIHVLVRRLSGDTDISLRRAFAFACRVWSRLFIYRLIVAAAVLLGLICLIVPGVIFAIWFILVDAVVCIEGRSTKHVLSRSMALTRGRRLGIFVVLLVAGLCLGVVLFTISLLLSPYEKWISVSLFNWLAELGGVYFVALSLAMYLGIINTDYDPATDPLNPYDD